MSKTWKWTLPTVICVVAFTLLLVSFASSRKEKAEERERESAVRPPSAVSLHEGQTVITLQPNVQTRLGLSVASLSAGSQRTEQRVPAFVLSVEDLGGLRNDYVLAVAKLEKARANLQVSQKEYDRLKGLYHDNQNASAKALEAAEGTLHSNEADIRAAEQGVRLQRNAVRQRWGQVITEWVVQDSARLRAVLEQHEFLVQITVPAGSISAIPQNLSLEVPGSSVETATLVSAFPRVDSRVQGPSYLYAALAKPGIAPGMNLVARLAEGAARRGVTVPETAAIWWEGRAWVYRQAGATTFVRQELPIDSPARNGWFVASGLSPGDKVVVRGAESLLSTELGSQAGGEQGEEEEEQ